MRNISIHATPFYFSFFALYSASVTIPTCQEDDKKSPRVFFVWKSSPGIRYKKHFPTLFIEKYSLQAEKSYKFSVYSFMENNRSLSAMNSVIVETASLSELIAVVKGPTSVSSRDSLILSAKDSIDLNRVNKPASFSWLLLDTNNIPVVFKGKDINTLIYNRGDQLNINVTRYLRAGQKYKAVLRYRVGARRSETAHEFEVVQGKPPFIEPTLYPNKIDPSRRLVLQAKILSQTELTKVTWSSDVPGISKGKQLTRYTVQNDLMVGGANYNFTVCATNLHTTACYTIPVQTNKPPTKGTC